MWDRSGAHKGRPYTRRLARFMVGSFFTDVVVVILVLGLMIFVHELGHFMAAKYFGVRVLVFSLGFGKPLLHVKRGDTDYRVSILPFGGYVKMAGEDPNAKPHGDAGEFLSKPRWQRFVIVVMGPVMNIVLAVFLLTILYRFHFPKPAYDEQPARVGAVEDNSPASQSGLKPGDLVVRLANLENPHWEEIEDRIVISVGEPLPLEVERDGKTLNLTLTPRAQGRDRVGYAGMDPYAPAVINKVEPGLPASQAGLEPGDVIEGLGGQSVLFWPRISYLLQADKGKPERLTIRRGEREFDVTMTPVLAETMGEKRWRIGISFRDDMVVKRLPWRAALVASLEYNFRKSQVWLDIMERIVTRRLSTRSLAGPIGIAQLSGEAYREGLPELIMLVSFISLNLGLFNLLPIPVLDGGVLLMLLIEGLLRRDLSLQIKERFVQVGFLFLLLLVAFLMYNDLMRTFRPS